MYTKVAFISFPVVLLIASTLQLDLYAAVRDSSINESSAVLATKAQDSIPIGSPEVLGIAHGNAAHLTAGPGTYIHQWIGKDGLPFAICDRRVTAPSPEERVRLETLYVLNQDNTQPASAFMTLEQKVKEASNRSTAPTALAADQAERTKVEQMIRDTKRTWPDDRVAPRARNTMPLIDLQNFLDSFQRQVTDGTLERSMQPMLQP